MSDHFLLAGMFAMSMLTLYITLRMAMALQQLKTDADKTIAGVKQGPFGAVLGVLGFG